MLCDNKSLKSSQTIFTVFVRLNNPAGTHSKWFKVYNTFSRQLPLAIVCHKTAMYCLLQSLNLYRDYILMNTINNAYKIPFYVKKKKKTKRHLTLCQRKLLSV